MFRLHCPITLSVLKDGTQAASNGKREAAASLERNTSHCSMCYFHAFDSLFVPCSTQTFLARLIMNEEEPLISDSASHSWRKDHEEDETLFSDWKIEVISFSTETSQTISTTYHVHKFVLAVGVKRNEYFHRLFLSDFSESHLSTSKIELHPLAAATFPVFLDYMYSSQNELSIDTKNATALYFIAAYFENSLLEAKVEQFWRGDVNLHNLAMYEDHARIFHCEEILEYVSEILEHLGGLPLRCLLRVSAFLSPLQIAELVDFRTELGPQIFDLSIAKLEDMVNGISSRLPHVRHITFWGNREILVGLDNFPDRLIPFLASFPKLEQVCFPEVSKYQILQLLRVPDVVGGVYNPNRAIVPLSRVIERLCDAYASGDLPSTVNVLHSTEGLYCPRVHGPGGCALCNRVISTLPLEHLFSPMLEVVRFRHVTQFGATERPFEPWMIPVIGGRPGGRAFLERAFHAMRDS